MPTTRTRRPRRYSGGLDEYRTEDLLGGPGTCLLAAGYGGIARKPLHEWTAEDHAAVREAMRADWARHGSELLAAWCGETEGNFSPYVPRGGPGTRPWGWWTFDAPEPREPDESDAAYLDRLKLWRPGEKARYAHQP